MNYKKYIMLALTLILLRVGCAPESPTLVTVGNDNYTIADFKEVYQFAPADDSLKRMNMINEYVNYLLMVTEARARDYENDPVVITAFETNRKDVISRSFYQAEVLDKIKVKESDIRKVYNNFVQQYHLAQIVVAAESLGQHIEKELQNGVSFDSLLKFSLDTVSVNGDIGKISAAALPPEILDQLRKTEIGGVTKPIQFGDYYYILKVLDYQVVDSPKYEDVRVNIEGNIMREKAMEKGSEFVQKIIDNANVEYNDEGLNLLLKPESLLTEADLNTWVVKKYDTAYVNVKTIIQAVQHQYQRSFIEPKQLIDRVLTPDLVYDEAIRRNFDKKPETEKKLQVALEQLLYQKLYSDEILEHATVDSMQVVKYYKENKKNYQGKKFSDVYLLVRNQLREQKIQSLRKSYFENLREKYKPVLNDMAVAKLLKEEM
jgi:inhibitor of KinA sporulation pathway (predicted exonuclease)